jgi:hypothetical protein
MDRELALRGAALAEERQQRHQVQLGRDDELEAVKRRAERAHVALEAGECRRRIPGNARALERGDEE